MQKTTKYFYALRNKSKGIRNILLLRYVPARLGKTKDDSKCKPALLKFSDISKGGTDIYQRMGIFSVNIKSKRWAISAFSCMLNTIPVNS